MSVGLRTLVARLGLVLVGGVVPIVSAAQPAPAPPPSSAPLATAAKASCPDSARTYWTAFRHTALNRGAAQLADMSRFPFIVKGTLDDSPARRIARKEFVALLPRLLRTDPGLQPTPSTMKALLRTRAALPDAACSADGKRFRVGEWLFESDVGGWRFVQAFVED